MTAIDTLNDARRAWERSQPQLFFELVPLSHEHSQDSSPRADSGEGTATSPDDSARRHGASSGLSVWSPHIAPTRAGDLPDGSGQSTQIIQQPWSHSLGGGRATRARR